MDEPLHVLGVVAPGADLTPLTDALRCGGLEATVERAPSLASLRAALRRASFDLVLCDGDRPRPRPAAVLETLRTVGGDTPLVVLVDPSDEVEGVEAVLAGADDYVLRGHLVRLVPLVRRLRREAAERAARRAAERTATAAADRLRSLIERLPSGVVVFDAAGRTVLSNEAARRISGARGAGDRPVAELLGGFEMREPESGRRLAPAETATMRALAGETVRDHEHVLRRVDGGAERRLRSSAAPLLGADGAVEGAVVVFTDVTEHWRLAERAALAEERARAADRGALAEYERLIAGLAELAQGVGVARDLAGVFRALRAFVATVAPCSGLYASLYDPERRQRTCVFAWSEGVETDTATLPPMPMNDSPHARAVATGQIIVTDDFQAALGNAPRVNLGMDVDPRLPQSSLAAPMAVMGRVIGGFEVQSTEPAAYRPEHLAAMRLAANLAAIAVENVRLLERERRLRVEAQVSGERFRTLVQNASDAILVLEPDGAVRYASPAVERLLGYTPEEITGRSVFETMHPADARAIAEAGARGERFEADVNPPFTVRHRHKDGSWRALEAVVNNLVADPGVRGIVVNSRDITERLAAEEHVRREAARARSLAAVASRLTAQRSLDAVLQTVCEETARALDVPVVTISLYDARRDALVLAAEHGLPAGVRAKLEPLPRAVYDAYTAAMGPVVVVEDVQALEALPNAPVYSALDVRTTVGVTMQRDEALIGRLNVASLEAVRRFAEDELALLRGIADQAALAIDNARLYQELAGRRQELQDLVARLLAAHEEERRRVAYEVHDGLAQVAAAAHQHLQAYAARHRPREAATRAELERVLELTQRSVREARRVVAGLRPTVLDDLGLAAALRLEAEMLEADGWEVRFTQNLGMERLPAPLETALYRVAQEALSNVRKHAGPTRVAVRLTRRADDVRLVVEDWGRGFGPSARNAAGPGERVGLAGMQERVGLLRGTLRIRSRPGRGARVIAEVPLT